VPLNWSFVGADNGFFGRLSAHASNAGPNSELPAIIAIDPGQKNIWCASAVHPTAVDKRAEAKPVLNLTRRKYNQGIGLLAFRNWLDTAKKNMTEHDFVAAQDALSEHTLKGVGLVAFEANFVVQRRSFEVPKHLYGSRSFGKRRFVRQQRRQRFDATFTNSAAAKFRAAAGKDDFVVAYGDGSFPLTIKGMDGGGSAHKRLMTLLSKKVLTTYVFVPCRVHAVHCTLPGLLASIAFVLHCSFRPARYASTPYPSSLCSVPFGER
jgi:hypothetical protein